MTIPLTIGVAAVKRWKELDGMAKFKAARDNGIKESFYRPAYYGGMTDNFCLYSNDAFYFDINSSYPFAAKEKKFPIGIARRVDSKIFKISDYEFFVCNCNVEIPLDLFVSPLPYRTKSGLIFPVGKVKNINLNSVDVRSIESRGGKIKINKVFVWDESDYLFREYMSHFYKLKCDAVDKRGNIINPGQYHSAKIIMNSLTGKLGQKPERSFYINDIPENDNTKYFLSPYYDVVPTDYDNYCQVKSSRVQAYTTTHQIGFITAHGRELLLKSIYEVLDKGGNIYYCDTDSLICDIKLKSHNTKLGHMKLEDKIIRGYYISPKLYGYINTDGEKKIKCKGLSYNHLSIHKLRQMLNKKKEIESHKICVSKLASYMAGTKKTLECYDLCRFTKRNDNKKIEGTNFKMHPIKL